MPVEPSCFVRAIPRRLSSLGREFSGDRPNADDDPPVVIQDMDPFSSLTFEFSHAENPTPNSFEIGRRVPLARQP